jgi:hypothetical protein
MAHHSRPAKLCEQPDGGLLALLSLWERTGEGALRLLVFSVGVSLHFIKYPSNKGKPLFAEHSERLAARAFSAFWLSIK